MNVPEIIAVDGPAASGKSTIAEELAKRLAYMYFDTGVMYRAVTWSALRKLGRVNDEEAVSLLAEQMKIDVQPPSVDDQRKQDVIVDGEDATWLIRSPEVDANVSQVSAYARVRTAMTEQQRRIGRRGRVVMAGRDIGTVVFPDAGLKIFLNASAQERARRRHKEQVARGEMEPYDEILASLMKRDDIDSNRTIAPLKPADDAVIIETDGLSIEQVLDAIMEKMK